MFHVYERRQLVKSFPTFDEAEAWLKPRSIDYQRDESFPGCADAYTLGGLIYCIEPEGFKVPE